MLSYQHLYHAGCLADVHKHLVLAELLAYLLRDPSPLIFIDTHAGRGVYDLDAPEAQKTGEAAQGIQRLLAEGKIAKDHPLMRAIASVRDRYGPSSYPGSPWIARHLLRPADAIHLMELHPREYKALAAVMKAGNIRLYHEDGYAAALRITPPPATRGVVLIDPSFEVKGEYLQAAEFVQELHDRWPEAIILLWYPLLKAAGHAAMIEQLEHAPLPGYWKHEEQFCKPEEVRGVYGSGLVAVNWPEALRNPNSNVA